MAVQVPVERAVELPRPHLYVIDFSRPQPNRRLPRHPQAAAWRRRRLTRRLRQAGEAVSWTAGVAVLLLIVIGGLAGLR